MAGLDEYDYLERQVDAARGAPAVEQHRPESAPRRPESDDDNNTGRRSRSRDRSRDRKRRSRSRSRDQRRRDRDRSRDRRERSRSYSHRSSRYSRSRSPVRRRSRTPPEERMARERERELKELERATRTAFAFNLSLRVDERDLFEFFSKVGRVVDIRLITDKNTKKSRGLAYIEFSKVEEVISAVAMAGHLLKGQPVMVKASEAEKNMAWEAQQQAKQAAAGAIGGSVAATSASGPCWLSVGGLHPDFGEAEVQQLFAPFGSLGTVTVARDAAGRSTGCATVQYMTLDAGVQAMTHWHGRKLSEHTISVTAGAPPVAAGGVLPGLLPGVPSLPGVALPGIPTTAAAVAAAPNTAVVTVGELDDDADDGKGGIKLSSQSRAALMSKLAGGAGLPPPPSLVTPAGMPLTATAAAAALSQPAVDPNVLLQQGALGPASPIPTPCLLLKNMFDPASAAGDAAQQAAAAAELAAEVEADVKDEASRFGEVVHCWVDPRSKGFVYLRFAAQQSAEGAQRTLHGRWYGGRQIVAEYQFLQVYNSHFKLAK